MNCTRVLTAFTVLILIAAALPGIATAANIVVINNDGVGEGFNDPTAATPVGGNWGTTVGQQRLIAFQYAANIWAACLQSNVDILVQAQFDPQYCSSTQAVLGSAGTTTVHANFANAPQLNTWYCQALANSLAGTDLDPTNPDINATFNSNLNGSAGCLGGIGWYYGLDGNPGSDIDFVSVLLHEMGHGLGFQTFVSQSGVKLSGLDDQYMIYLENHGASPPDYPSMTDAQRAAANIADPNLHWIGPLVTAEGNSILSGGISGGHVRMHGPNPYQPGSSVSHWSTALLPNELMEPNYTGANHDPRLAWTLMSEIGWNMTTKVTDGCASPNMPVDLAPSSGTMFVSTNTFQDRGAFVTAIKRFDVCALGIEGAFIPGETITAKIYAANGTTRGALLTSGSAKVEYDGQRTHYIPIQYQLQPCQEYDIAFEFEHTVGWPWWNETTIAERPFDAGGVIRVRDGELSGGAGNNALLHFTVMGSSSAAQNQDNFAVSANCSNALTSEHGAFITARQTHAISALGVRVDFAAAPGTMTAYVYEATGTTRGALVAEGSAPVPSTGGLIVTVPLNAVLEEGQDYDVGFTFSESTTRYCHDQSFPYAFAGIWDVNALEVQGAADPGTEVPAFRVSWSPDAGGEPFDLVGPWHTVPISYPDQTQDNADYGIYVTSLQKTELYSIGWRADVPAGETIGVNVYEATGTSRGALIASGSIVSGQARKVWHDVPVSASLAAGQDYDLEIDIGQVDAWDGWNEVTDGTPTPYNAYGLLEIVQGEQGGNAGNFELIHMRVGVCSNAVTAVEDGPAAAPKFALAAPYPNPVRGRATLDLSLDEPATVSVAVYDVSGRKVADVVQDRRFPAGPAQLELDGRSIPSGVYFVKMSTATRSVSRKITVVR